MVDPHRQLPSEPQASRTLALRVDQPPFARRVRVGGLAALPLSLLQRAALMKEQASDGRAAQVPA
jgi:hypothetical protein